MTSQFYPVKSQFFALYFTEFIRFIEFKFTLSIIASRSKKKNTVKGEIFIAKPLKHYYLYLCMQGLSSVKYTIELIKVNYYMLLITGLCF